MRMSLRTSCHESTVIRLEVVLTRILHHPFISGLGLDGDLLACLMPLVLSYSSLELQSRAWTLIMRQASQLSEAVAAAKDMQLLTSHAAVVCFNAITDCSRRISDLTTGAANGDGACVQGLRRVLHELVQLTRRGEYDLRLVENNQRLMRWQKLHKQVHLLILDTSFSIYLSISLTAAENSLRLRG